MSINLIHIKNLNYWFLSIEVRKKKKININAKRNHSAQNETEQIESNWIQLKMQVLTFDALWDKVKSTILAANIFVSAIDPDVSGLDQILRQFQRQIAIQHFFVDQSIWWWF